MEATLEDVKRTLRVLIAETCGIDSEKIRDETTIDEDLQLPSIAFVELQVAVEEAFDTILDPVEVVELNKFGLIAESIHHKMAARIGH
jgi:acyl carrier protein